MRQRRAATLIEVIVTITVLSAVAAMVVVVSSSVAKRSRQSNGAQVLSTAQLAARRLASNNSYRYPPDVVAALAAPGLSFTPAASDGDRAVSVSLVSERILAMAVRPTEGHCLVLIDTTNATPHWAVDKALASPANCSAARGYARAPTGTGTAAAPAAVELD